MVQVDKNTLEIYMAEWERPLDLDDDQSKSTKNASSRPVFKQSPLFGFNTTEPYSSHELDKKGDKDDGQIKLNLAVHANQFFALGETKPTKPTLMKNMNQKEPPSKELTGVDPAIVKIAACVSQQIYDANNENYFQLQTSLDKSGETLEGEVKLLDKHGDLNAAVPAFSVVTFGKTLILGWRGTNQVLDFITDTAIVPVVCAELGTAAKGIRCHATMAAIVSSDLKIHEEEILSIIKKCDINNLVFTGHSLGGALAQVAHLFVQAQINGCKEHSRWGTLEQPPTLKTVAFAAPMAIMEVDAEGSNEISQELVEDVGKNTVNFLYSCDFVPRAYSHVLYLRDVLQAVGANILLAGTKNHWYYPNNILRIGSLDEIISRGVVFLVPKPKSIIRIASQFRHVGTLLYYHDESTKDPQKMSDTGPIICIKDKNGTRETPEGKRFNVEHGSEDELKYYSFDMYKKDMKKGEYADTLLKAHSFFPKAFAPHISVHKEVDKNEG